MASTVERESKKESWWQIKGYYDSPRDRILLRIREHGGEIERNKLERATSLSDAKLGPLLDDLAREGRIRISGEIISLAIR